MMKLENIYDSWECAIAVKQVAFPLAIEVSSSHIGGIRIKEMHRDWPNWFYGLSLVIKVRFNHGV